MKMNVGLVRKFKMAVLSMGTAGMLFGSACAAVDVKYNVIQGTMAFIKSYTTSVWGEIIPPAEDLFGTGD